MHSIFLSYSFQKENKPLVKAVQSNIDAVGFRVIDGKILDTNHVGSELLKSSENATIQSVS